jgi:hypothetical protein
VRSFGGPRDTSDRGASVTKWGAALFVAAGVFTAGAVVVPNAVSGGTESAICRVFGTQCDVDLPTAKTRAAGAGGMAGVARATAARSGAARSGAARTEGPGSQAAFPANGQPPAYAAKKKKWKSLFIKFMTRKACKVYPNYPKRGVRGNTPFTIPKGEKLIWRYNVNKRYAVVSWSERSKLRQFPWWGFTARNCIGRSPKQSSFPAGKRVPNNILKGRSNQTASGWRTIDFRIPKGRVVGTKRLKDDATLRDRADFVIGNVPRGWRVQILAGRTEASWVKVYVPNAKRVGYILRRALR